MSVTKEDLAGAIAYSLDARIGMLFPEDAEATIADLELADSLLARYDITPRT
jgi:hypothetical protein